MGVDGNIQQQKKRPGTDSTPVALRGNKPCQHLDLDFSLPEMIKDKYILFLWYLLWQPQKGNTDPTSYCQYFKLYLESSHFSLLCLSNSSASHHYFLPRLFNCLLINLQISVLFFLILFLTE